MANTPALQENTGPKTVVVEPPARDNDEGFASLNGFVAVGLAIYLALVVYNGHVSEFLSAIKTDIVGDKTQTGTKSQGFLKWFIAFVALWVLANNDSTKVIGAPLFGLAMLAMVLQTANTQQDIFNAVNKLFALI